MMQQLKIDKKLCVKSSHARNLAKLAMLLSPLILFAACSTSPLIQTSNLEPPPPNLLQRCDTGLPEPTTEATLAEVANVVSSKVSALKICAARQANLSDWVKRVTNANDKQSK